MDQLGIHSFSLSGKPDNTPPGHTKVCWAGALGRASRGRPPEDLEVREARAREMLATDPEVCGCVSPNKGTRGRRQR